VLRGGKYVHGVAPEASAARAGAVSRRAAMAESAPTD
jgi:hypothetical protein